VIANGNLPSGATVTLGAVTLTVQQNTDTTFGGSLADTFLEYPGSGSGTTGPLNLLKRGPATLRLSGANSYSGTTTVGGGTLTVNGMTPDDIKQYIRFIADWRLRQLKLPEVYGVTENPLPWLQSLLSGVEHANFFEARATEYSKAATQGAWHGPDGVWDSFDAMMKRRKETEAETA